MVMHGLKITLVLLMTLPTICAEVYLHGNHIATVTDNDLTLYSGGGWFTNTTKSRLNALIKSLLLDGSNIFQKNFNWYVRAFNTVTPFHDGIVLPVV